MGADLSIISFEHLSIEHFLPKANARLNIYSSTTNIKSKPDMPVPYAQSAFVQIYYFQNKQKLWHNEINLRQIGSFDVVMLFAMATGVVVLLLSLSISWNQCGLTVASPAPPYWIKFCNYMGFIGENWDKILVDSPQTSVLFPRGICHRKDFSSCCVNNSLHRSQLHKFQASVLNKTQCYV